MAEAFALASSIISVASSAIQLADSVQKASDFWESVVNAPEDISRLSKELRLLSNILRFISHEHTSAVSDSAQDSLVMSALQLVREDVDELSNLVAQLGLKVRPVRGKMKRKWGEIQIALKSEKIRKMKCHVESAKGTLTMLQTSRAHAMMCQLHGRLEFLSSTPFAEMQTQQQKAGHGGDASNDLQEIGCVEITETASQVSSSSEYSALQSVTKSSWASINAGLLLLSFQTTSTTFYNLGDGEDDKESTILTKRTFTVNFLWGYSSCRRGIRISMDNHFDSLVLNAVRRRASDSAIFMLCRKGDTLGVSNLLQTGEASLFDTNQWGEGLLHCACKYGHSDLAVMLLRKGIDYYMKSDIGTSALDELRNYDETNKSLEGRKEIARITETLLRETDFDPFRFPGTKNSFETLVLWHGLPLGPLRYLLSQDSRVVTAAEWFNLIFENVARIGNHGPLDGSDGCIDLLLEKYNALYDAPWPFGFTILQLLILQRIFEPVYQRLGSGWKISRCLALTNDLYTTSVHGTCLDVIAMINSEWVEQWLDLLRKNGVDVSKYLQYEFDHHPKTIVDQGDLECCRVISLRFRHEKGSITKVEVENICKPGYIHFHPDYRCEAGTRRERCITQLYDIVIDANGRPKQNVPGSWLGIPRPNSGCFLVIRRWWIGMEYVEELQRLDDIWVEASGKWEIFYG